MDILKNQGFGKARALLRLEKFAHLFIDDIAADEYKSPATIRADIVKSAVNLASIKTWHSPIAQCDVVTLLLQLVQGFLSVRSGVHPITALG